MASRRYADNTTVSIGRSRGEIDDLLRAWGCDGLRWTDQWIKGITTIEFMWKHDGANYLARLSVTLESEDDVRKRSCHATHGTFLESTFKRNMEARGRSEMRTLHLWLKAAFHAVDAGIVSAEALFLPFLVGADGQTVAEVALPRLSKLLGGGAGLLLGDGNG